jgi:hypothetical protein
MAVRTIKEILQRRHTEQGEPSHLLAKATEEGKNLEWIRMNRFTLSHVFSR